MKKFLALIGMLLFLSAPQVFADTLVIDVNPGDNYTNPDYFTANSVAAEQAWLEALLGFDVLYLGKDDKDVAGFDGFNKGNWTEGSVQAWDYAVLKYGAPNFIDNHWAIIDDNNANDIIDYSMTNPEGKQDLSHVTYFGNTAPVPEPATMLLLGSGLIGLAGFGRKKFKR